MDVIPPKKKLRKLVRNAYSLREVGKEKQHTIERMTELRSVPPLPFKRKKKRKRETAVPCGP